VQSLRGDETLLATIVGPDFPVVAGANSVPVASSAELTATVAARIAKAATLRLDAYGRRMTGIIGPAGRLYEPFATKSYTTGSGEAWGLGATLDSRVRKLSVGARYSVSFVSRSFDSLEFRPAFAARQAASLSVGYAATRRLALHSAFWLAAGRPTTVLADDIGWDTSDALTASREVSGTPGHPAGSVDGSRLPYFLRWDVGARFQVAGKDNGAGVSSFIGMNNLFGRENIMGYVRPVGAAKRGLSMLPASLVLGLEWVY
jgi:hypothetical protein